MPISTTSDLNGLYNDIYEESLFVVREQTLMVPLVRFFTATGYADRTVGQFSQVTVQKVAEGVDYSNPTTLSKSEKARFTPGEAMGQYLLTDRMIQTDNVDDIVEAASTELGGAIAEEIDTDLMGVFDDFDVQLGTAGSDITIAIVAAAISRLQGAKARGERNVVLHPYHWYDIWTELGQPATNQAFLGDSANEAMREYAVGRFIGASWYASANAEVDVNDDAVAGVFVRDALAFDQREAFSVRPQRDESLRATEMNGHVGYAVGALRSEHGVGIVADASEPTGS